MRTPHRSSNEARPRHVSQHCAHADPSTCKYHSGSAGLMKEIGYVILAFFQRHRKLSNIPPLGVEKLQSSYRDPTERVTTCNHAFMLAHEVLRGKGERCDLCRDRVPWIWTCSYCTRFLCNRCKRVRVDTIDDD